MVLMDCYKSIGSFDPFLEIFTRLSHLGWYVLQSMEEIIGRGLNHAPTEGSEIVIFLVLRSDLPPVTELEGFGFDSPAAVPVEVGSLSE